MAVLLVIEGEEVDRSALTVDLSPHGLRLQTAAWLTPGQQVGLLPLPDDSSKDVIGACVVWVGKAETYQAGQAGLAFLRPLANKFAKPSGAYRRLPLRSSTPSLKWHPDRQGKL
jgi:hypothetical protein